MKNRKLQFSLATFFIALTAVGVVMSIYRHFTYVDEQINFHVRRSGSPQGVNMMGVLLESREALLAGDEYRLESLATRYHIGQPMEIAYVPAQLADLDNAINKLKEEESRKEAIGKYHREMAAEFEKSRWRPWHRIPKLAPPPEVLARANAGPVRSSLNPQLIPIVGKPLP